MNRGWPVALLLSVALANSAIAKANEWEFREDKDRLTDTPRFTIARIADSGSGPLRRAPFLIVQCSAKKAALVINVGITGIAEGFDVQYRLDKLPAASVRMRSAGSDSLVVAGMPALDLIDRLGKQSELYIRVQLPIGATAEGTFRLEGFSEHLNRIRSHCA
jgi:hypothetical protein